MAITKVTRTLLSTGIVDNSNATAITIDSSENVGIGTSSPVTGLEVATTNYTFTGTNFDIYGLFGDTSGGIRLGADSSTEDSVIGTTGTNNLQFVTYNGSAWGSRMTLTNTGNVGIGTSSPTRKLVVKSDAATSDNSSISIISGTAGFAQLLLGDTTTDVRGYLAYQNSNDSLQIGCAGTEAMRIDSSGNVGIGTSSPFSRLQVLDEARVSSASNSAGKLALGDGGTGNDNIGIWRGAANSASDGNWLNLGAWGDSGITFSVGSAAFGSKTERMRIDSSGTMILQADGAANLGRIQFSNQASTYQILGGNYIGYVGYKTGGYHRWFGSDTAEKMRLDSSGNLLVGTTSAYGSSGVTLDNDGVVFSKRSGGIGLYVDRETSDGALAEFRKDGTKVGNINVEGLELAIGHTTAGLQFLGSEGRIRPFNISNNAATDNTIDLGRSNARFDDIFATNGTIQTSDRNEKQDIEALTEAETRVAVAAKGLLRKFRWQSAVASKGDDARIHFGIIAQDLQDAFTTEGLDAGDYAMFISDTWTDDDGVEQTRLGVRYSELLAFIIAAI